MTFIQGLLLGLLQGLTEFLPVSSSGHLVIAQHLFNITSSSVIFDILVHLATGLAIVVVLWSKILKLNKEKIGLIILATIPAALVGFFLNKSIEVIFSSLPLVGISLIITSLFLFSTRLLKTSTKKLTSKNSFTIGLFQALAIIPGISRSGSTIVAGLHTGLKPITAFNFSLLLFLPAILGAQLLQLDKVANIPASQIPTLIIGFITAFFSGLISLKLLQKIVIKSKLYQFGYYCLILGVIVLILL